VYKDAKFHKKNVDALYTDYSDAFNIIDQHKLLHILYRLCFPNAAIEAVKDLYAGATTLIKIHAGATEEIAVARGVLQGDTLSPFLFNCFMEPLQVRVRAGSSTKCSPSSQVNCRTAC